MGSAFAQGFQMGSEMYDSSERMRLAKAAEERAAEQFGWLRTEQEKKAEADRLLEQASQERGVAGTGVTARTALDSLGSYDSEGNLMSVEAREALAKKLDKLSPEQAQQAIRAYGKAYGRNDSQALDVSNVGLYRDDKGALMASDQLQRPSEMEAARRYETLAAQSGNSYALKDARANRLAALQISGAQRTEDQAQEFQKLKQDWNQQSAEVHDDINRMMDDNDVDGVLKKYGPLYKQETGNQLVRQGKNILVMGQDGKVVDNIPESQFGQKLDQAMSQYYTQGFAKMLVAKGMFNSPGEAISYMTKQQEIANQSRMAGAAEMNAETNRQYHGTGGVAERIANAHNATLKDIYAEKASKPVWKTVTIDGGMDANGVKQGKRQAIVGITMDKDGRPVVSAYTPDGKQINDPNVVNQAVGALGGGTAAESGGFDSAFAADLGAARKRYEAGNITLADYQKEVADITLKAGLPKAGQNLKPESANPKAPPPIKPITLEYSDTGYDHWLAAAKSKNAGDASLGKAVLLGWLEGNSLGAGRKEEVKKLLGIQ